MLITLMKMLQVAAMLASGLWVHHDNYGLYLQVEAGIPTLAAGTLELSAFSGALQEALTDDRYICTATSE